MALRFKYVGLYGILDSHSNASHFVYLEANNNNKSKNGSCFVLSPYCVAGTVFGALIHCLM